MTKIDAVKQHFKCNADRYLIGGGCLLLGGSVVLLAGRGSIDLSSNSGVLIFKPKGDVTVNLVRRMHPGFRILCNETGEQFASIRRTAEAYGLSASDISRHLRGLQDNVGGKTFTNLGEMVA